MNHAPITESPAWEREFAPKVSRGQVAFWSLLYAAWMIFLAVIAVTRWFGSLQ